MTNRIALPIVLVLLAFASTAANPQTTQSKPKLQTISGLPVVDGVYINGQGPFRFLIDTGDQTNEMDPQLARTLGLTAASNVELDTPAGISSVPRTLVSVVSLGTAGAVDQEFLITDRAALRRLSPDIRGTIGQKFLSQFDYMLDFRHGRLIFGADAPAANHVAFHLAAGCMAVSTELGDLIFDSGSDSLFLFRSSAQMSSAVLNTSNSSLSVAMEWAPSLHVSGKEYFPEKAVYHPVANAPASGLLPANLFHGVYVSNSAHFLVFDPK